MQVEVVNAPSVYVVGRTHVEHVELTRFKEDNRIHGIGLEPGEQARSHAELMSEVAGRLCYWSFDAPRPGGNRAYLDRIKDQKHGSILEHASYNFIFTGISRTLTHELVRHRAGWAFSQLSQRYVDETDCRFVRPVEIQVDTPEYEEWYLGVSYCHDKYRKLVSKLFAKFAKEGEGTRVIMTEIRKRARQAARSVLPGSTETKILATANVRSIRHFLEQRGSIGAEPEIRRLANMVLAVLRADSPNVFADYSTTPLPDGTATIRTDYPKV